VLFSSRCFPEESVFLVKRFFCENPKEGKVSATSVQRTFLQGLNYLQQNHLAEAANAFRFAFKEHPGNPQYVSYYGLILALYEGNFHDAVNFCRGAIVHSSGEADYYLNLCRVYAKAGQRKKALETLLEGMRAGANQSVLKVEMKRMGCRRKPVLPFLSRDNILNKSLGKLTYQLRKNQKAKAAKA
jgi:tetratricopeptide (TPR) repeat protein